RSLGVLDRDVEVAAAVEDPGVAELELGIGASPAPVLLDQAAVRELGLGVLVERLEVGVGRGRVEVEVALLDVLAVVPLVAREAEEALLEDGVAAIPQRQREAQPALPVADAEQSVLA